MKRYLAENQKSYFFIALQSILYVVFLTLDLHGCHSAISSGIKFSMIILCFCFALIYGKSDNKSIAFCVKAALLFTLISDAFLLLFDYYIFGLMTFILVQQLYSYRIILANHKKKIMFLFRLITQMLLSALICIILGISGVSMEVLLVLSVFYFICIASNTFFSVRATLSWKEHKGNVLYAIGMVLFLMCDINVGIFNMSGFIALPESIYHSLYQISSILMWTFYAPAQVMIALSVLWVWQNKQFNYKISCKNM